MRHRGPGGTRGADHIVEVVGAGGIGKTAIAIAVGRMVMSSDAAASGGVWLARLETA